MAGGICRGVILFLRKVRIAGQGERRMSTATTPLSLPERGQTLGQWRRLAGRQACYFVILTYSWPLLCLAVLSTFR